MKLANQKTVIISSILITAILLTLVLLPAVSSASRLTVPGILKTVKAPRAQITEADLAYTYHAVSDYEAQFGKAVPAMHFMVGNSSVEMAMAYVNPSDAIVRGPKIIYPNAFENTIVTYTTSKKKVKEHIILKKEGMNEWHYILKIKNANYEKDEEGNIVFTNDAGEQLFIIEKPFMQDSPRRMINYQGSRSNDVDMEIYEKNGNTYLKITADEEWLSEAYYPVTIDPTIALTQTDMSHYGAVATYYGGKIIAAPTWCWAGDKGFYSNPTYYSGTYSVTGTMPPIGGYFVGGPGTTFCSYYYTTSSWTSFITTGTTYPKIHCNYMYPTAFPLYTSCTPGKATYWPTTHCPSTCLGYYGGYYYTTSYYTNGPGYCPGTGYGGATVPGSYVIGYTYMPGSCSYGYGWAPYSSNVQTGPSYPVGFYTTYYSGTTWTGTYSTSYYRYTNFRNFIDFNVSNLPPSAQIRNVSLTMNVTSRGDITGSGVWINITELDQPAASYNLSNITEMNLLWSDIGDGNSYAFTSAFNSTGISTVKLSNAATNLHNAISGNGVFSIGLRVLNEYQQYIIINNANTNLTVTYDINQPTATISKSGPAYALPGENITYTITYGIGNAAASNVRIYETYPSNFTYLNANPGPSCGDNQWIIGDVANGGGGTITINVSISENLTLKTIHCNTVNITYDDCLGNQSHHKTIELCTILGIEPSGNLDELPWSGGGGGAPSGPPKWYRQYYEEKGFTLGKGDTLVIIDETGKEITVYVERLDDNSVFLIVSDPDELSLTIGESGTVDTNNNGMDDTRITLESITGGRANLKFEKVEEIALTPEVPPAPPEEMPAEEPTKEPAEAPEIPAEKEEPAPPKAPTIPEIGDIVYIAIAVVLALAAVGYIAFKK